ncbi:hypothetical protein [Aquimarina sp. MMG016]|uniref:hypothetical protein n=1 Tax=Aquimarina sp. MMG016 TaxID=2822690 RepID=UPI001B3A508C|nr:hypothetical protein [Aquimarina sp. MMG016]MBQ4819265.1 hypothetical protein [Aquimarina sp. MMG016]
MITTKWLQRLGVLCLVLLCFSCYSVKIVSTMGTPNPDPMNDNDDDYRNKRVIILDTVIKAGTTTDAIGLRTQREGCSSGKLHSVEYKNTFGGSLLYLVTFGNKRKVRVKYVCMKTEN